MYMNKLIKKQLILILFTVVLVGTLVVTTSFAVFEDTKSNAQDQKMAVGDLDITFTGGSAINITNLSPMTDTTAKSQTNNLYTFSIANTGTVPYKFTVKLENNPSYTSNLLPHKYIRYSLNNATVKFVSDNTGLLVEGMIEAGVTNNYSLRLWVADAETYKLPDSSLGQEIHLQINVDGKAGGTPSTTPDTPTETDKLANLILKHNTVSQPTTTPGLEISSGGSFVLATAADDYGTSYYFRGNVLNNHVSFADLNWRIVRITGNGAIKLVLDDTVSSSFMSDYFTASDNGFIGLMYGDIGCSSDISITNQENCENNGGLWTNSDSYINAHSNINKGSLLKDLENWYNNNLSSYEDYLADTIWCNDKSVVTDTLFNPLGMEQGSDFGIGTNSNYYGASKRLLDSSSWVAGGTGPSLICPNDNNGGSLSKYTVSDTTYGNGALDKKIGLLTADEVAFAGTTFNGYVDSTDMSDFYLYGNTENCWVTATASEFGTYGTQFSSLFTVCGGSGTDASVVYGLHTIDFRPAISLLSNVKAGGTGTEMDPYVIVGL